MTWWELTHNRKVLREAHRFSAGDYAIVRGYVITKHPDIWRGFDGQFRVDMWRVALIVDVARQGSCDEFVKIVVVDNKGHTRDGYIGRWTPRDGDGHVQENVKYLEEEEYHAQSDEQGSDHQASGRSGSGNQRQDTPHCGDPESKFLRPYMAGDKAALREVLQRMSR